MGKIVLLIDLVVHEFVHLWHEVSLVVVRLVSTFLCHFILALGRLSGRISKTPTLLHGWVLIKIAVVHITHEFLGVERLSNWALLAVLLLKIRDKLLLCLIIVVGVHDSINSA